METMTLSEALTSMDSFLLQRSTGSTELNDEDFLLFMKAVKHILVKALENSAEEVTAQSPTILVIEKISEALSRLSPEEILQRDSHAGLNLETFEATTGIIADILDIIQESSPVDISSYSDFMEMFLAIGNTPRFTLHRQLNNISSYISQMQTHRGSQTKRTLKPDVIAEDSKPLWRSKFLEAPTLQDLLSRAPDSNCSICMSSLEDKEVALLPVCDHIFCLQCLQQWFAAESSALE